MDTITKLGIVIAIAAGTYGAFKVLEDSASATAKSTVSAWLKQANLAKDRTHDIHDVLHSTLTSLLGGIFTRTFLFWSFLVSLLGVLLTLFVLLQLQTDYEPFTFYRYASLDFIVFFLPVLLGGLVGDFLSLAKSVLILRAHDFSLHYFKYYALDIVLSVLMALGIFIVLTTVGSSLRFKVFFNFGGPSPFPYVTLITGMIPTVLILIFVMSAFLAKTILIVGRPLEFLRINVLDIERKPFQAIGFLLAPVFFILALLCLFIGVG